jgi:hypothetical protein
MALTSLFLAALAMWSSDTSEGQRRTRRFIETRLKRGEGWMKWVPGAGHRRPHHAEAQL